MSKFFQLYTLLFLGFILLGCSQQPLELKIDESLIETAPDSLLHILQNLSPITYKSGANRALYELTMIRVLYKKQLPLKPDSMLDYSISYYEKHPEGNRLAYAYLYKGKQLYNKLNYEDAITHYLKSRDYVKDSTDYLLLGRICSAIGRVSYMQKDEKYSLAKYKEATRYYQKGNHLYPYFYSIIDIGRSYANNKELKSALLYLRKINSLATDSMKKGDLFDEMGYAYYKNGKVDSALYYYRMANKYPYSNLSRPVRYMEIANAYFDTQHYDSAKYYASNAFNYKPVLSTQRECHRILGNIAYFKNDRQALLVHMNQYTHLGDSLRKIDSQPKGSYIERLHKTTKQVNSAKRNILFLSLLVVALCILFILIFLMVKRRHKNVQSELEQKHDKIKVSSKQQIREKSINAFHEKVDLIKLNQVEQWKKSSANEREKLLLEMYNDLLQVNDWTNFSNRMKPFFGDLIPQLQTDYPTLTQKEIKWCCFLLLRISLPDILTLIDYSQMSYSKFKQRIAKKLNLDDATGLSDFLDSKLSEI